MPAGAQTGPTPAEAAAYRGLHAAAHKGDVGQIEKLAAVKADLNTSDGNGRTPLHVAAFAGQRNAIPALAKAGANLNLLDNDRYDGVTIASVANDEETLSVLLAEGASAKLVTSRCDGTALIAAVKMLEQAGAKQRFSRRSASLRLGRDVTG